MIMKRGIDVHRAINTEKTVSIIGLLIVRLNRGLSLEQAIEEVSELKYPIEMKVGLEMTKSTIPLEWGQIKEYYYSHSEDYFFLLLECLRVMRTSSWEPYRACDALIVLRDWIIYNQVNYPYVEEPIFGFRQKLKPGALAQRAQEILFDKLQGIQKF